jgi:hypothetical protein
VSDLKEGVQGWPLIDLIAALHGHRQ